MSWLEGLAERGIEAFGYENHDFQNPSTNGVKRFTYILNALGYILGPLVGVIRLLAAAVITCQATYYEQDQDGDSVAICVRAKAFVKEMALRGLIELTWIGGLIVNPLIDAGVFPNR